MNGAAAPGEGDKAFGILFLILLGAVVGAILRESERKRADVEDRLCALESVLEPPEAPRPARAGRARAAARDPE